MARIVSFEVISNTSVIDTTPVARDPAHWHQAIGVARQACARIFRDGGTAADAIRTFGISTAGGSLDWSRAVEIIAESLSAPQVKRAA